VGFAVLVNGVGGNCTSGSVFVDDSAATLGGKRRCPVPGGGSTSIYEKHLPACPFTSRMLPLALDAGTGPSP
jgi:hypothetical protein